MSDALRPVTSLWMSKIQHSHDYKQREFGEDAEECARFYDGPYDWLYSGWRGGSRSFGYAVDEDDLPGPSAQMTVNKTAELVQLFGPSLYHRNPVRKVSPRKAILPPAPLFGNLDADPMAAQMFMQQMQQAQQQIVSDSVRAEILERYLNYTPTALDLKTHIRWAIDEALIKGMGCMWTQHYKPPGMSIGYSGSFQDSVDHLEIDPDVETLSQAKWIARRHCKPIWEVERTFNLKPGTMANQGHLESYTRQSEVAVHPDGDYRRKQGLTADLLVYWEIFSKMGMGGRLAGLPMENREKFDSQGDYCYLVICETLPYPLNLPPPFCDLLVQDQEAVPPDVMKEISQRLQWPTPFWADGQWPMTPIAFHYKPRHIWPMSHMKPGLGELKFLNWAWSFLASKVRTASRDFLAISKSAGEELKDRIKHGTDYTIIEVEAIHGSIDKVVQFLQHPTFNPEIYKVIEAVTVNFERRVGLTELMYGLSNRQMRSAEEASIKNDAISVRPDEMANKVEDAATDLARKEAFVCRWHLLGQDVTRVLGPVGAQLWEQLLLPTDPEEILYSMEYRVEAGSARKPNKARNEENMKQAVQNLFQPLFTYAQATGQVGPINALISAWAKSIDLEADEFLLKPPPPPMPGAPPPGVSPPQGGPPPSGAPNPNQQPQGAPQ